MLLLAAPLALIAACSDALVSESGNADVEVAAPTPYPIVPVESSSAPAPGGEPADNASAPAIVQTKGGDGSEIALTSLQGEDARGLTGELACSFRLADVREPMLIGRAGVGDDARGAAVIRNGGYVEQLVAREPGGFGAMERGLTFGGRGMTVTIDRGNRVSGGEAPSYDATLLAQRADGAERLYSGLWTCGP